jgi:hypothetical protein
MHPSPSRRAVARTAAWTVPAMTLATAAPVMATSTSRPLLWYAESRTNLSIPDYSNHGYTAIYVNHYDPVQPGYLKVMHWAAGNTLYWRPALGVGLALDDGVIVFTLPDDQVLDAVAPDGSQGGVALFNRFTSSPSGVYTVEQAQWAISVSGNTVTLVYSGTLPAQSAALWVFTSHPASGPVLPDYDYTASATFTATIP